MYCTTSPNQNNEDVVTKKNNHVNATESLWLLKKVGLHFSTCFVASELQTIKKLIANTIIIILIIKYLLNK